MAEIVGTFRLPPATLADARPAMAQMIAASRAEDGCLDYAYAEDVLDAGLIRVMELWRDQTALDHHFASAHIGRWRSVWPELGIHGRDLRRYEIGPAGST